MCVILLTPLGQYVELDDEIPETSSVSHRHDNRTTLSLPTMAEVSDPDKHVAFDDDAHGSSSDEESHEHAEMEVSKPAT